MDRPAERLTRTQVITLVGKFARLTPAGARKVIFSALHIEATAPAWRP
jgi:hypothetical protein